jgi:hypothetical protein
VHSEASLIKVPLAVLKKEKEKFFQKNKIK